MSLASQITLLAQQIASSMRISKSAGVAPTNPYPGQLWYDSTDTSGNPMSNPDGNLFLPTGLFRTSFTRAAAFATNVTLTSGQMKLQAIWLNAGEKVTSLMFVSGATAMASPTHWWFALYDINLNLLGQTADQTTAAWAALTMKTLPLTAVYTVPTSGYYYVGVTTVATTTPSVMTMTVNTNITGIPPVIEGSSTSGLSAAAPAVAAAPTRAGLLMYCGVG